MAAYPVSQEVWQQSVVLNFYYEGEEVHLYAATPVEKFAPPSDALAEEETAGFWITLTDDDEAVPYRRVMHAPIRFHIEVFSDDPEVGIVRIARDDPSGTFTIRVPDMPEATAVSLFNSPPDAPDQPARLIARFDLFAMREQTEET